MKIGIATDHNGVNEKKELINYIISLGYEVEDYSKNNTPVDDYPDYATLVANAVVNKDIDLGILLCGTGIGMSIAANKVKGVYAAKVSNLDEARLCKEHNNANIMTLSYKEDLTKLKELIRVFLATPFSNEERHIRRINKIKDIENN